MQVLFFCRAKKSHFAFTKQSKGYKPKQKKPGGGGEGEKEGGKKQGSDKKRRERNKT